MAAPMIGRLGSIKILRPCRFHDFYRTFLSESYKCDELWKKRLESKYLQKIDPKKFGIELLDNFEKTKTLHASDIDLFVNKIQDLQPSFCYLVNEVLYRFRHCQSSIPIKSRVMHGVVRGFLDNGEIDQLVEIIKDKSKYGVFPDAYSMCMLIDHFLMQKNYKMAAEMAYEVMLQENYKSQTLNLLSLYAAVKHYMHTMDKTRPEPVPVDEDEEVVYTAIKVIRNLYYDDHFDIKDERFLLGKTLYLISRETSSLDGTFSRSLQLIGLGLYEKFEFANQLIEKWMNAKAVKHIIYKEALEIYSEFLEAAPTRDPDAEPKAMGLKTIDDEIEMLKLTPEEKAACLTKLETLKTLLGEEKMCSGNIEEMIEGSLTSEKFTQYYNNDIKILKKKYSEWENARDKEVETCLTLLKKQQVSDNILEKFEALHERENLLTYFSNIDDIKLKLQSYREPPQQTRVEDEYVEAPGERNVRRKIKKRKK